MLFYDKKVVILTLSFEELKRKEYISDKTLKYFIYEYKRSANLQNLYKLPKIHKRLSNVSRTPAIFNCGELAEKVGFHLKKVHDK